MASEASSRSEPYCPFEPGQEEEARAYLSGAREVPDLRISKEELRPRVFRSIFLPALLQLAVIGLVVMVGVVLIYEEPWSTVWAVAGSVPAVAGLLGLMSRILLRGQSLHVSGQRGTVSLGGKPVAVFEELGVPSFARSPNGLVIALRRRTGNALLLFNTTLAESTYRRLPEYADHINALLAEYHQRQAVERWLAAREAELSEGRAYRSEADDG